MLKATFLGSFKDWDVSKDVIPSTDVTGDIKRQLEVKFLEEDVVGQGLAHVTFSFENDITISEYPQAYRIKIETYDWYFKPIYSDTIQYKNDALIQRKKKFRSEEILSTPCNTFSKRGNKKHNKKHVHTHHHDV